MIPKPYKPPHLIENHRPISLLEVPGKAYEKILNSELNDHLESNNLLSKYQLGFRKGKGTDMALAIIHETVAIHLAQHHYTRIVLRDVKGAFDKVWHDGLIYKLGQLNTPNNLLRSIHSFLRQRTAIIQRKRVQSQSFALRAGVPQGAMLSPALRAKD